MDYKDILNEAVKGNHFFTNIDLRVNKKHNYLLNNKELEEYINFKEQVIDESKIELNLKTFNSNNIFYFKSNELLNYINDYFKYISDDLINNVSIISDNYKELILSRIASELDGTLKIEGVNTTRKQVLDIIEKENIKESNEQIILNMYNGYMFIKDKPEFNKENLKKLYDILSYNSLKDDDIPNGYYRSDMVLIGEHMGCQCDMISEAMDSLFNFVNSNLDKKTLTIPFIAHYYILYIHPYFDYNGRCARMVSLWISFLLGFKEEAPIFISEAINDDKSNYYKSIDNTRNSHNDLTYFLTYLYKLSTTYYFIYKNIEEIKKNLAQDGESITSTESYYLKRILINKNLGWFNYRGFIEFAGLDITKQGALKILNNFLKLEILESKINSKNEKVFKIADDMIHYEYK